jgi:hypothetical protein
MGSNSRTWIIKVNTSIFEGRFNTTINNYIRDIFALYTSQKAQQSKRKTMRDHNDLQEGDFNPDNFVTQVKQLDKRDQTIEKQEFEFSFFPENVI